MSHQSITRWIRFAVIGISFALAFLCALLVPRIGYEMVEIYPEFEHLFWFWLFFIWAAAIPCWTVLVFTWKISCEVKADNSFSTQTAKLLTRIAIAAFADTAFFFAGNIVFLLLGMNHISLLLFSLFVDGFGIVIGLAAAVLSRFVLKAAELQEESEGTV